MKRDTALLRIRFPFPMLARVDGLRMEIRALVQLRLCSTPQPDPWNGGRRVVSWHLMRRALASALMAVLVSCGTASQPSRLPPEATVTIAPQEDTAAPALPAPPPASAPAPAPEDRQAWLDECEASFRKVAARLSGHGKIITWRDRAAHSADSYEAFIQAAATDLTLVAGAKPHPDDDAIIFALGASLGYRIVLVSKHCYSGNWEYSTAWAPRDKYWDRDEVFRQRNGVSAAIHYDGRDAKARGQAFVDAFRSAVDTCIERRPPIKPENPCQAEPG